MFSWWLQSVGWGTGVGAGVWRTGFLVWKLKGLTRTLPLEILDHTQHFLALSLHLSSSLPQFIISLLLPPILLVTRISFLFNYKTQNSISISLSFPVIRASLLLSFKKFSKSLYRYQTNRDLGKE